MVQLRVKLKAVDGEGCFLTHTLCWFFNFCLLSVLLLLPRSSSVRSRGDEVVATRPLNNVASVPRKEKRAKPQNPTKQETSSVTGGSHGWLSQPACVNKLKRRGVRITHSPSWLPYSNGWCSVSVLWTRRRNLCLTSSGCVGAISGPGLVPVHTHLSASPSSRANRREIPPRLQTFLWVSDLAHLSSSHIRFRGVCVVIFCNFSTDETNLEDLTNEVAMQECDALWRQRVRLKGLFSHHGHRLKSAWNLFIKKKDLTIPNTSRMKCWGCWRIFVGERPEWACDAV